MAVALKRVWFRMDEIPQLIREELVLKLGVISSMNELEKSILVAVAQEEFMFVMARLVRFERTKQPLVASLVFVPASTVWFTWMKPGGKITSPSPEDLYFAI